MSRRSTTDLPRAVLWEMLVSPSSLSHIIATSPTDPISITQLNRLVQIKQAQSSLNEAESAHKLNNYIMLFTIITVIFVSAYPPTLPRYLDLGVIMTMYNRMELTNPPTLPPPQTPLSFLTSIFALSIDEFPQNAEGQPIYTSSWITSRMCE